LNHLNYEPVDEYCELFFEGENGTIEVTRFVFPGPGSRVQGEREGLFLRGEAAGFFSRTRKLMDASIRGWGWSGLQWDEGWRCGYRRRNLGVVKGSWNTKGS